MYGDADLIVVSETGYSDYISDPQLQNTLHQLPSQDIGGHHSSTSYSYIFNGVPSNWTSAQLRGFIENIKGGAEWLFLTDNDMSQNGTIYGVWGTDWDAFTLAMASN